MMVADKFVCLNIDYFAYLACKDKLLYLAVERSIAQHEADHDLPAVFLRLGDKISCLLLADGERLLEQHIVSRLEQGNGSGDMDMIHRAVNDRIGEFRHGGDLLGR